METTRLSRYFTTTIPIVLFTEQRLPTTTNTDSICIIRKYESPQNQTPSLIVGNNVNSPIRTSAIGLLQHLQLLYLPSELDIDEQIQQVILYFYYMQY
jgi:hypothetical protein